MIERLGEYAASLRYQDLTPVAVHEGKRRLIDALGCLVGGFDAVKREQGWDHSVQALIGSAMGAGRILGLKRKAMGNAISLAVIPNSARSARTRSWPRRGSWKNSPISESCWDCWRFAQRNARRRRTKRKP